MKIGIFGGSFNPIHKGHVEIAKLAIEKLSLDKLIFVPAFKSVTKKKSKYAPGEDRVKMIELSMPEKSVVSRFELERKCISHTIDTIRYFKSKYPDDELFFIIGSDNIDGLNLWKGMKEISESVQLVAFKREGKNSKVNLKKYNILLMKNELFNFASTDFKKGRFWNLSAAVNAYIGKNFLYMDEIAKSILSGPRLVHCLNVAKMAAQLASKYNLDAKKAYVAGYMHDIAKEWDEKWDREFMDKYHVNHEGIPKPVLHQYVGALWLEHIYQIKDEVILSAVRKHTTCSMEMSDIDKIIFIADKLARGRKFEGIQKERALAFKDLDQTFRNAIARAKDFTIEKHGSIAPDFLKIIERWK